MILEKLQMSITVIKMLVYSACLLIPTHLTVLAHY